MADIEPQPTSHITPERVIVPPRYGMGLTERTKTDCEMTGLDLIDAMVAQIGVIKDSKGADITDKARGQLQQAWSDTLRYTLNHQRPEQSEAKDALELIARLQDSRDTMSAMIARQGIQSDSWSPARKTLHTEVMGRYDGLVASLVHALWGHGVAPAPTAGHSPA